MKLLFDQNLSPRLVERLIDLFPGSSHVQMQGLDSADDDQIWEFARQNEFTIVTKDADYNNFALMRGTPPRVIWLLLGNCTTAQIEDVFRMRLAEIKEFDSNLSIGTLAISR